MSQPTKDLNDDRSLVDLKDRYANSDSIRKWHRRLAWVMMLPFLVWAITGLIFIFKPGYGAAYEQLSVPTYGFDPGELKLPEGEWRELRQVRTALGTHVLARNEKGWTQLYFDSLEPRLNPNDGDIRLLIEDAVRTNPERYGEIIEQQRFSVVTSTGTELTLDWNNLTLTQNGQDTRFIDLLYDLHYLRWTGNQEFDRIAGPVGLAMLMIMSITGMAMLFRGR